MSYAASAVTRAMSPTTAAIRSVPVVASSTFASGKAWAMITPDPVDSEMSRLPASPSPASMFHRGPCTVAHDRESGAVDDERRARARRSATNRGVEMLTTP